MRRGTTRTSWAAAKTAGQSEPVSVRTAMRWSFMCFSLGPWTVSGRGKTSLVYDNSTHGFKY